MQEYQTVMVRLAGRARDDEDAMTDLLNERARMGWRYESMTALATDRLLVVFVRDAGAS
jgi:hypothetical protein